VRRILLAALLLAAGPLAAEATPPNLTLPEGARETGHRDTSEGLFDLPTGPYAPAGLPSEPISGRRSMRAFALPDDGATTALGVFSALAAEITGEGWQVRLRCAAAGCGGFDFRAALTLLPPPDMFVDLAEFYVLTATHDGAGVMLLVSRSATDITGQLTWLLPGPAAQPLARGPVIDATPPAAPPPGTADPGDLAKELDQKGWAVLGDVHFDSGATDPGKDVPASLTALAAWMAVHPDARIALVGHTDPSGSMAANMTLSRERAAAVAKLLSSRLGVTADRITSDGVGPLAPRSGNTTEAGRTANRRVEAVVIAR